MEYISTLKDTWKIFIIGGLIGCFMLLLLFNENGHITSLSEAAARENFPPFSAESDVLAPSLAPETSAKAQKAPEPLASMAPETSAKAPEPLASMAPETSAKAPEPLASMAPESSAKAPEPLASMAPESSAKAPEPVASIVVAIMAPKPSMSMMSNSTLIVKSHIEKANAENSLETKKVVAKKKCDIFDGRWVYKADAEASYCPLKCPFLEEKMSCKRNGRPDLEYEKWVWEPNECHIPLVNGTDMVERFRNKRIILVGDSLNRNMWESLSCILYSNIPYASSKAQILFEGLHSKTFLKVKEEYNFTIEFYWTPYLVELNKNHQSGKKVLQLDKLAHSFEDWKGADVMIFNSGHHWTQVGKKRGWELFEYKGKLIKDMPLHQAYSRAMRTWANWVEKNVDPMKTRVFYRSISHEHISAQYNQHCYSKTQPMEVQSYKSPYPSTLIRVVEGVVKEMKRSRITYLNITKLTASRIDAHPSIYRDKDWKVLTKNSNKNNVKSLPIIPDCGHWCLPGIPDTWNRLLYASLFFDNYVDTYIS